jgi:hypothetical protein
MSQDLPYATPYPWDNEEMEESYKRANASLRKRRFVGSGFAALYKQSFGSGSTTGDTAKSILTNLLQQNNLEFGEDEEYSETNADELYGSKLTVSRKETVTPGISDEQIISLARDGKLSLFQSLLKGIDGGSTPVTTKHLIRTCCLTLRPADVPGSIDSKEMILSALYFLSSTFEASAEHLVSLPLIRPLQEVGDLEKRSYEKSRGWKLSDISDKLLHLEQAFMSSSTSWNWLGRDKFSPRLPRKEEASFFMKGTIPPSATGKKPKGEGTRKRKASSPAAGFVTSPVHDAFDSTSVVEATIVVDASPTHSIS